MPAPTFGANPPPFPVPPGLWTPFAFTGAPNSGDGVYYNTTTRTWGNTPAPLSLANYGVVFGTPSQVSAAQVAANAVAVQQWLNDLGSTGRAGLVTGIVTLPVDTVSAVLVGTWIYGWSMDTCGFAAYNAPTGPNPGILIKLHNSAKLVIERLQFDGQFLAKCGLDVGSDTVGASCGHELTRVWTYRCTDRQADLTNCGDTVLRQCKVTHQQDSACGWYWPNSGGNVMIYDAIGFSMAGIGTGTTPVRACLETSGQNITIINGGMYGIKLLDGQTTVAVHIQGCQLWPIRNGANINAQNDSGSNVGTYTLTVTGGSKLTVLNPGESYVDGKYRYLVRLENVWQNSADTATTGGANGDGTCNLFGANFAFTDTTTKGMFEVHGGVRQAATGASYIVVNDSLTGALTNANRFYSRAGNYPTPDVQDIVRAGSNASGTGVVVGGGATVRVIQTRTDTPWSTAQVIPSGSVLDSGDFTAGGYTGPGVLTVSPGTTLPAGVIAVVQFGTSVSTLRIQLVNVSGSSYTLPAATAFRTVAVLF